MWQNPYWRKGDVDMSLGYQRVLDGPASRHAQWCSRTRKCETFDTIPIEPPTKSR
jgi:hypothetical protein